MSWFNILQAPSDVSKERPLDHQVLRWSDTDLLWIPHTLVWDDVSGDDPFLLLDGSNANQNISLGSHDITAHNLNITNWDDAYSWGDHALVGYLTDAPSDGNTYGRKDAGWVEVTGGTGTTNHSELDELLWSEAGHTFDADLSLGGYKMLLTEISAPETPASGDLYLYAKDVSGASRLFFKGDDGSEIEVGSGGGGDVSSVFGRIGDVVATANDYTWADIDKTISDIADLTTKSHTSLDDIGTTSHADIDTHVGSTSNPHSVTASQVGAVAITGDETVEGLKTFTTLPQSEAVPSDDKDLVNKVYVDAITQGLIVKDSCRLCAENNIALTGIVSVDGENTTTGDRVLVKGQSTASANGIYVANNSGAWSRATDYDSDAEVVAGTFTYIVEGDTLFNTQWVQYEIDPEIGVDPLSFRALPSPNEYTASNGLNLDGMDLQLGGTLTENTTLTLGGYNLDINLASTGLFRLQASGTTRFQFNNSGLLGIGTTPLTGSQAYILPSSTTTKGLTIRANTSQTSNLLSVLNSAGTEVNKITGDGYLAVTHTNDQDTIYSGDFRQTASTLYSYVTGTNDITQATRDVAFKLDLSAATGTTYIRSIAVRPKLTIAAGNPTGYLTMYIYSDNAGQPGTSLATGGRLYLGQVTTAYATVPWAIQYNAPIGTYWVVIRWSASPTGGGVLSYQGNSAITNEWFTSPDGTTWTDTDEGRPRYYVYGRSGIALYGRSESGNGVYGYSSISNGVYGYSIAGYGVYGQANRGYGGYFTSTYGAGVGAASTYGTAIAGTSTTGYGVDGVSTSGTALRGTTTSGIGLYAVTSTGTAIQASTTSGTAIYVSANNATGNGLQEMLRLRRTSSGTVGVGIGAYVDWEIEDDGGGVDVWSRWIVKGDDVTNGAEKARLDFQMRNHGALTTRFSLAENGVEISYSNTGAVSRNNLRFIDTDTSTQADQEIGKIEFYSSDTGGAGAGVKASISAHAESTTPAAYLSFRTDTTTGTPIERMRIAANGDVKIGSTTSYITINTVTDPGELTGDFMQLSAYCDSGDLDILNIDAQLYLTHTITKPFSIGDSQLGMGSFYNYTFDVDLTEVDGTLFNSALFAINTRDTTVNQYTTGQNEINMVHYFTTNNTSTYSGTEDYSVYDAALYGGVETAVPFNSTGKTLTHGIFGYFCNIVEASPLETAGTHNIDINGIMIGVDTSDSLVANPIDVIGLNFNAWDLRVGDNGIAIHDPTAYDWQMKADNKKLFFGAGLDASMYYDGTNLVVDPAEVGDGGLIIYDAAGVVARGVDGETSELNFSILYLGNEDDPAEKKNAFFYGAESNTMIFASFDSDFNIIADTAYTFYGNQTVNGKISVGTVETYPNTQGLGVTAEISTTVEENTTSACGHFDTTLTADYSGNNLVGFTRIFGSSFSRTGTISGYGTNCTEANLCSRNWFSNTATYAGTEDFGMNQTGHSNVMRDAMTLNASGKVLNLTDATLIVDSDISCTETAGTLNITNAGIHIQQVKSDDCTVTNGDVDTYGILIDNVTGHGTGETYAIKDSSGADWYMNGDHRVATITVGSTELTEANLIALLALL